MVSELLLNCKLICNTHVPAYKPADCKMLLLCSEVALWAELGISGITLRSKKKQQALAVIKDLLPAGA
jgi:hypothetical protein